MCIYYTTKYLKNREYSFSSLQYALWKLCCRYNGIISQPPFQPRKFRVPETA